MTIGVMMPFYGDVDQFKSAVKSLLLQSDPDWRLTIVDDRYPDSGPREFVRGLNDARIKYIVNEKNLGISANFQMCINLATFEYTTIMGCDDILLPHYIERVSALLTENPAVSYLQPGVAVIDDRGRRVRPLADKVKARLRARHPARAILSGEALAKSLLRGNWTYFPALCWRTDVLREFGFRQDYRIVLDLSLQLEIILSGGSLLVDDDIAFEYRRHERSASSWAATDGSRFTEEAALFAEAGQKMSAIGWASASRRARWHLSSRLNAVTKIPAALLAGNATSAGALISHAFHIGPAGMQTPGTVGRDSRSTSDR
jgi:GT2 family glycosyltransferase